MRPHAVTSTAGTPALALTYDADGNLATQGSSAYTYDAENRLKTRTVSGGTVTYTYDANGTMVKRTNADGTWTVYVGGVYEKNSDGSTVKYYAALGKAVAMRRTPAAGASTLYYTLSDHLGSTSVITDTSGAVVASQKYWPYGATRTASGTLPTDKQYTGQQVEPGDSALGLYNYKARFYSTTLGRFVSADSVTKDGLNRYTYVRNNPVRHSDPSGQCILGQQCTIGDVSRFIRCASGGDCKVPTGVNEEDVRRLAGWALGQDEFWGNVFQLNATCGCGQVFIVQVMATIGRNAQPGTLDLISDFGYQTLSHLLGMDRTASEFLKKSLSDLLFGTSEVSTMAASAIVGASPWWEEIGTMMQMIEGGYTIADSPWEDDVFWALVNKTIEWGTALQVDGADLQHREWSPFQWEIIKGKLGVNPPEDFDPSGCVTDPECIGKWARLGSEIPPEYPQP